MRTVLFLVVFTLLVGALMAGLMRTDPGYVLVYVGEFAIEMSFWTTLILVFLAISMCSGLVVFARWLMTLSHIGRWWENRRRDGGQRRMLEGLHAYSLGVWDRAAQQLIDANDASFAPGLNLQFAARAQAFNGDLDRAKTTLKQLKLAHPDSIPAADRLLADLLLHARQNVEAEQVLWELHGNAPTDGEILVMLVEACVRNNSRAKSGDLLAALGTATNITSASKQELQQSLCHSQLSQFVDHLAEGRDTRDALNERWDSIPRRFRKVPEMVAIYARGLASLGCGEEAKGLLVKALSKHWHSALIEQFGAIQHPVFEQDLVRAEKWLVKRPTDVDLLIALGRICRGLKFNIKASDYLQQAADLHSHPLALCELAELKAVMGDVTASAALYRRGLQMALSNSKKGPAS